MIDKVKFLHTTLGWFIETDQGRIGPMETELEARTYLSLMRVASLAGSETACTDQECIS